MQIYDYIIRGGENLNDAPRESAGFPANAAELFDQWHTQLDSNDDPITSYLELPVDRNNRLFIRVYHEEKRGHRPVCYYVGLLSPKSNYQQVQFHALNRGLVQLRLEDIQRAMAERMPIQVNTDWPAKRSPIGAGFRELAQMKCFSSVEFEENIDKMRYSISTNNIDEWFDRLFIAVNPKGVRSEYHVLISRKRLSAGTVQPEPPPKVENHYPNPHRHAPRSPQRVFSVLGKFRGCMVVVVICLVVCLAYNAVQSDNSSSKNHGIEELQKENAGKRIPELEREINGLRQANERLNEEKDELWEKVRELENELKELKERDRRPASPSTRVMK